MTLRSSWTEYEGCEFAGVELAENPSRRFYEALGGQELSRQDITIGGATLVEVAYGWKDIGVLGQ